MTIEQYNNKTISAVFFGTHNFAATVLQGLIDSGLFDIQLVITQPDRPVGRKQELLESPVKVLAKSKGIPLYQPEKLKNADFKMQIAKLFNLQSEICNLKFDLGICAQYGLIIPESILNAPKHGTINVHTSLLPKYRGASPIQTALMNGETQTGVTIMKMDAGLDTGPIVMQKTLNITPDDTYTTLYEKMAKIAILGLLEAIPKYISGALQPVPQDNSKATVTKQLSREDGRVDWQKSAQEIYNQWRGLTPWPGVWTDALEDKRMKLLSIVPVDQTLAPGRLEIRDKEILVGTKKGGIKILELQIEGKNKQTAKQFINGYGKIFNA